MYTECPYCQTLFRIRADQLRAAQGTVRCGQCQELFDALLTLRETPVIAGMPEPGRAEGDDTPHPPSGAETTPAEQAGAADEPPATVGSRVATGIFAEQTENAGPPREDMPPEVPARLRRILAAAEAKPPSPWRAFGAAVSLLLFTLFLGVQVVYFRPAETVAAAPVLAPWVQAFCERVECAVTVRRAPDRMVMLNHDVRAHPEVEGALLIKATFANEADFAQPFPDIGLTLSDLTDTVIASRRFAPREYLPPDMVASTHEWEPPMVPPRTPVYIDLEVLDPGEEAINYQFDFY